MVPEAAALSCPTAGLGPEYQTSAGLPVLPFDCPSTGNMLK
jgi:hypothetical protein